MQVTHPASSARLVACGRSYPVNIDIHYMWSCRTRQLKSRYAPRADREPPALNFLRAAGTRFIVAIPNTNSYHRGSAIWRNRKCGNRLLSDQNKLPMFRTSEGANNLNYSLKRLRCRLSTKKWRRDMQFFLDESGNSGDLARTGADLDFGGQPVFSLAAIGISDESDFDKEIKSLRIKHNIQASELKLSKILKRKPDFAFGVVDIISKNNIPFLIEIVDKKYQLAISIVNGFVCPPYFSPSDSEKTLWIKKIYADYLYYKIPDQIIFQFVECMNEPSNDKVGKYFDLIKAVVSKDGDEVAQGMVPEIEESKDDFRIMIDREGECAYKRFLPLPDIGKKNQVVWILPNFGSFTNIYARMNLLLSGSLQGRQIFHDEQDHFDEIIASAKAQVENLKFDGSRFRLPYSDYNFTQASDLFFKASPERIGIQAADIVAGLCMRWYLENLKGNKDAEVLNKSVKVLLKESNPSKGIGINLVAPGYMANKLFNNYQS